jgi:SAM-dependent methyltransferase
MPPLHERNPVGRFNGRAEHYARGRPDYPAAAVDYFCTLAKLGPKSLLVDVGCGTGISSRLFAARGVPVLGIEPNADMRRQAEQADWSGEGPAPHYQPGQAEATGLPDAGADAVLAAQAFHWFKADAALREFHRILQPGGWVALMWNERDEADPFTRAYGTIMRSTPEAHLMEATRASAGEVLLKNSLFTHAHRVVFPHEQWLDEEGLLGRALSVSYAPAEAVAVECFTAKLRCLFAGHQRQGKVRLQYQTSIFCGQKS